MSKIRIACPECGYGREVDASALPAARVKVTCPKCKNPFVFDRDSQAMPPPSGVEPPAPAQPVSPPPATREAARITCPGCGYFKDIPAEKVPATKRDIKCPKCSLSFPFGGPPETSPAQAPPPEPPPSAPPVRPSYAVKLGADILGEAAGAGHAEQVEEPPAPEGRPAQPQRPQPTRPQPQRPQAAARERVKPVRTPGAELTGIGGLFEYSWGVFKTRALTLIPLQIMSVLLFVLIAACFGGAGYLVSRALPSVGNAATAAGGVIGAVAGFLVMNWVLAGFFFAVVNDSLSIREALSAGRMWLWSFIWLNILMSFIIMGGYLLFIIPGVIFTLWFAISPFVMAEEGETGMSAMLKSREYVKQDWPGVLLRLFVVWLVMMAVGMVPVAGVVLTYIFMPFAAIYVHRVYIDLKAMRGDTVFVPTAREKGKWLGAGALGYVVIPLIIVGLAAGYMMKNDMSFDQMMKAVGLNMDTISLSSLKMETGKGGELEDVYTEYRNALDTGDIEDVKSRVAKEVREKLDGPGGEMMVGIMRAFVQKQVYATGADISGDSGTLYVESEQDGGVVSGKISFVKEDGEWKVAKEDWDMTVRPKKVTLSGGKGAPGFDPVNQAYFSQPLSFGMTPATYFNKDDKPRLLKTLTGHDDAVSGVAFLPGGRLVSCSYADYTVRLWDVASGAQSGMLKLDYRPTGMAATPDGDAVVVVDAYGGLTFIDIGYDGLGSGVRVGADLGNSCRIAVSPNGKLVAVSSFDKTVAIWDLPERKELVRIQTPEPMRGITFSPSGQILAAGSTTNKLTLWDLSEGKGRTYTIDKVGKDSDISAVTISSDSKYIVTGHNDSSIVVFDLATQKELHNYYVTDASTSDARFSPDGKLFATAHANDGIYLWEPEGVRKLMTLTGQKGYPIAIAFSPEGSLMASCGADKNINIWGTSLDTPVTSTMDIRDIARGLEMSVNALQSGQTSGASVSLDSLSYKPGARIKVRFTAPPGYKPDAWVGIIPSGVSHGSEAENDRYDISYQYLSGRTSGEMEFDAPSTTGTYDFRMHDTDAGGKEVAYVTFRVETEPRPAPAPQPSAGKGLSGSKTFVTYHSPKELDQVMVYIYSLNYKGKVKLNGKEYYDIKGERDMNYNSTDWMKPEYGLNRFELDYRALPDAWKSELRIKVYTMGENGGKDNTIAEWVVDDKGGYRTLDIDMRW